MGLRCRKGDLAIVTNTPNGDHIGKMVDVIKFHGDCGRHKDVWQVRLDGKDISEEGRPYGQPDKWLLPIRPDELKEEEEREVTA